MGGIKNGVTLIELMIVVAYVGILAAIAAPMFMGESAPSGHRSQREYTVEQHDSGYECKDGFLFKNQNGNQTPVLADSTAVKC